MSPAPRRDRASGRKVYQSTLRLPPDVAQRAALAARVEGLTFVGFVRAAVEDALASLKADPDFQRRLTEYKESEAEAFRQLSTAHVPGPSPETQ